MKYVVVTRYNIGLYSGGFQTFKQKHGWKVDLATYWKTRLEICHQFTYQSLKKQTDRDFEWWLWIDKDTPNRHKTDLLDRFGDIATLKLAVHKNRFVKDQTIITKIDNDDILANDFIETTRVISNTCHVNTLIDPKHILRITSDLDRYNWATPPDKKRINNPDFAPSIYSYVGTGFKMIFGHVYAAQHVNDIKQGESYAASIVHGLNRCFNSTDYSKITPQVEQILSKDFGLDAKLPRTNK